MFVATQSKRSITMSVDYAALRVEKKNSHGNNPWLVVCTERTDVFAATMQAKEAAVWVK